MRQRFYLSILLGHALLIGCSKPKKGDYRIDVFPSGGLQYSYRTTLTQSTHNYLSFAPADNTYPDVRGTLNKDGDKVSGILTSCETCKYTYKFNITGTIKKSGFRTYYIDGTYDQGTIKISPGY
jgi:hypothetical protein